MSQYVQLRIVLHIFSIQPAKRTVVDIPATSRFLKDLPNKNGYSVRQLQERKNTTEYGTYGTLVNQFLEGLADIEEGWIQNFEKTMKEILEELGV